jgi:hypothetical protein
VVSYGKKRLHERRNRLNRLVSVPIPCDYARKYLIRRNLSHCEIAMWLCAETSDSKGDVKTSRICRHLDSQGLKEQKKRES